MGDKENQQAPKRKKRLEDWFAAAPHHDQPSVSAGARPPLNGGSPRGGLQNSTSTTPTTTAATPATSAQVSSGPRAAIAAGMAAAPSTPTATLSPGGTASSSISQGVRSSFSAGGARGSPRSPANPSFATTTAPPPSAQGSPRSRVSGAAGAAAAVASPSTASRSPRGLVSLFLAVPQSSSIRAMVDMGVDEAWAYAALRRCGGSDVGKAVEFCCGNDMDALAAEDAVEAAASSAFVAPQVYKRKGKTSGGRAGATGATGSGAAGASGASDPTGPASSAAPCPSAGPSATAMTPHRPPLTQKKRTTTGKCKGKGKIPTAGASAEAAGTSSSTSMAEPPTSLAEMTAPDGVDDNLGMSVCGNLNVKLDKVDIAKNENRHYTMEVCFDTQRGVYLLLSRWGRQGYRGQTQHKEFLTEEKASAAFKKTFKDKTRSSWEDFERGTFKAKPGQYAVVETVNTGTADRTPAFFLGNRSSETQPCRLDPATQRLVEMILSKDTMELAMLEVEVDMKQLPLVNLSERQVEKGYAPLGKIKDALQTPDSQGKALLLQELSNLFYKAIPHASGQRARLPVINTNDLLLKKVKMLDVLRNISKAMCILNDAAGGAKPSLTTAGGGSASSTPVLPHPTDMNYGALNTRLELVDEASQSYDNIKRYFEETKGAAAGHELLDLWSVDRQDEARIFAAHDGLGNRKLLWHGTNVAVVAAILKEGLRIMPQRIHGGRVGNGIYLASEAAKSLDYVTTAPGADGTSVGVLFLCEAALGKEASITEEDWRLTAPPEGYDSIVARGKQEPDPSLDITVSMDGKLVTVPQGRAKAMQGYERSKFYNSEYLVYKESQQRIRFILTVKF